MSKSGQDVDKVDLNKRIEALIEHRRIVASLQRQMKRTRIFNVARGVQWISAPLLLLMLVGATALTWRQYDMAPINILGLCTIVILVVGSSVVVELFDTGQPHYKDQHGRIRQKTDSVAELRLSLELAEEQRTLIAAQVARPTFARQYSYRDSIPQEIERLRAESASYRRRHNWLQWTLVLCSAAIPAIAALYDPPQPGKGILVGLGAAVSVITSVMGYFKFKEWGFNLQQTADAIEQHATALELGIAPYGHSDEQQNLTLFAVNVEALRIEQRKREQQLDQPHQGQQEVV